MINRIGRWLFCFFVNTLFNNRFFFSLLGYFNRRFQFLKTLYVGYSVDDQYIREYTYPATILTKHFRWKPMLAGFVLQNKKLGLVFFIASREVDFYQPDNKPELKRFVDRVRTVQQLTAAEQFTFAGVLPGVLFTQRIIRSMNETEVVVASVVKAIDVVQKEEGYPDNTPVIVLGGRGFIGRRVVNKIQHREVYCVDVTGQEKVSEEWPHQLRDKPAILVNISRNAVLEHYLPFIWPSLVLLNEVYPEPSESEKSAFQQKHSAMYHLAGVRGFAVPEFPRAYSGSIPCSAAWCSESLDVVVKRLV